MEDLRLVGFKFYTDKFELSIVDKFRANAYVFALLKVRLILKLNEVLVGEFLALFPTLFLFLVGDFDFLDFSFVSVLHLRNGFSYISSLDGVSTSLLNLIEFYGLRSKW